MRDEDFTAKVEIGIFSPPPLETEMSVKTVRKAGMRNVGPQPRSRSSARWPP